MAKYVPPIDPLYNTFNQWVDTTNIAANTISLSAVTTTANGVGSLTEGNSFVQGILSSNIIAVVEGIRGGTIQESSSLNIFSDVVINGNLNLFDSNTSLSGTNTRIETSLLEIGGSNILINSNINFRSNTLHVSTTGRVGVNTGVVDSTLKVFGSANVSGISTFGSDVNFFSSLSVLGEIITDGVSTGAASTKYLNVIEDITIASSVRARSFGAVDQSLQVGENVLVGNELQISNSLSTDILYSNSINILNPINFVSGGLETSSHDEGIMFSNNGIISYITGSNNQVMYYGDRWNPTTLPNVAYQNSTNVSITGGNIASISSLSVSGNANLSNFLGNTSNLTALNNITSDSLITSNPLGLAYGGLGNNSLSNNHLLVGSGSSLTSSISPVGHELYLRSDGSSWTLSNLIDALRPQLSSLVTQYYITTLSPVGADGRTLTTSTPGVKVGGYLMALIFGGFGIGSTFTGSSGRIIAVCGFPYPFVRAYLGYGDWLTWVRYGTWTIINRFYGGAYGGAYNSLLQRVA
jgi:hypothetical protein